MTGERITSIRAKSSTKAESSSRIKPVACEAPRLKSDLWLWRSFQSNEACANIKVVIAHTYSRNNMEMFEETSLRFKFYN